MALSDVDRGRLADIVELQPTRNAELQERWGLESGSEVHGYLEDALGEYYYRDDNSLIRATDEAASLVNVQPGVESNGDGPLVIRVPKLERQLLEVLPEPSARPVSVVAALHAFREEYDIDPGIEAVRSGLQALRRKDAVAVTYRLVPTYGLARPRDEIRVEAPASEA